MKAEKEAKKKADMDAIMAKSTELEGRIVYVKPNQQGVDALEADGKVEEAAVKDQPVPGEENATPQSGATNELNKPAEEVDPATVKDAVVPEPVAE